MIKEKFDYRKNMGKKFMRYILILLVICTMLFFSMNAGFAAGNTHNITSNMTTTDVQDIINNAADGDTLDFINQTYSLDQLNINKKLNLVSNVNSTINRNSTTVVQYSCLFSVRADNILISGFTINNHLIGIYSQDTANNLQIVNNTFTNCGQAIIITTNNSLIENNYIGNRNASFPQTSFPMQTYRQYAILIWEGSPGGAIIRKNTIIGSGWTYAIVNYAPNALITENNVTGIGGNPSSSNAAIANTLYGHGTNITGNIIDNNGGFGIRNDCDNVIIANNRLTNNRGYGIFNMNSHQSHSFSEGGNLVIIKDNIVELTRSSTGNYDGTGIFNQGIDARIINNTIKNNAGDGIRNSGTNTTILYNKVFDNSAHGINVATAGNNTTISGNTVYNQTGNNRAGIYFAGNVGIVSDNNVYDNSNGIHLLSGLIRLNNNTISNNNQSGLILAFSNFNLDIFNNTLKYNGIAINISGNNNRLGDIDNTGLYNEITENTNGVLLNGVGNIISQLNVYNNFGTAFIVLRDNNTITGCNVFDNNLGFNLTGNGIKINYNCILNNKLSGLYNYGNNNDFTFNWWGQNNISNQYHIISGSNYIISNWFVMVLSTELYDTIVNATIHRAVGMYNMTYKFLLYNNLTKTLDSVSYENLPDFLVNLTLKNKYGNIINTAFNVIAKGEYSYLVNLTKSDNFTIEAFGDNEDVLLCIKNEDIMEVNLSVIKSVNATTVLNGHELIYTIVVTNYGPDIATSVTVNEILDSRLILLNNETSRGSYDGSVWNIGNIGVGETVTLKLIVQINGTGVISNNVTVVTPDQNNTGGNNSTSPDTNVTPAVNITVSKTANVTSVVYGQTVQYTIVVSNYGPDNATGVIVNELLPSSLIYISSIASNGTYDPITGIWNISALNNGDSFNLVIVVRVNATGIITNGVNVTLDQENINNETNGINITENITVIDKISTNSTIAASPASVGTPITINGIAKDANGNLLANTILNVIVNGKTYNVATNNFGAWSLLYTPTQSGIFRVSVNWNGNSTHYGFVNSTSFIAEENILPPKSKKNTNLIIEVNGNKVTATLTDENGNPLNNRKIVFKLKGVVIGIGVTNKEGKATIYYEDAYNYKIRATFGGDDDYNPSNAKYAPKNIPESLPNGYNTIPGVATMKKTGMPIIAILLTLIAAIGLIGYRKRK